MRHTILAAALAGCLGAAGCGSSASSNTGASEAEKARLAEAERGKERVRNMERVLAADKGTTTGATSVVDVVARMRAIGLAGCPADFSSAYLAHIHAWEEMAELEREAIAFDASFKSTGAYLEAFVRGAMGDPFGKAREGTAEQNRLRAKYQRVRAKVRETFYRVEEVAVAGGATLPAR